MSKNNNKAKEQPAQAADGGAPAIKPPGKVLGKNVHGLSNPLPNPTPIDRLRAALQLSANVPNEQVLSEAADRLEELTRR